MQTCALQPIFLYKHDFYPSKILSLKYTQLLKAWVGGIFTKTTIKNYETFCTKDQIGSFLSKSIYLLLT